MSRPISSKRKTTVSTEVPISAPAKPVNSKSQNRMLAGLCALIAFLLYANTLQHQYTVDDGTVIQNNTITKQGIKALPEIFTSAYRKGFWDRKEGLYRPLSVAMFAVEWQIAPEKPWLGHLINVLLYAATGFVLFFLLRLFFEKKPVWLPFIITILFIVHPIHTEVVANIKSRDEILCFLFAIMAFYSLLIYIKQNKVSKLIISASCYFLALMSKESAVTLLAVFPIIIYFYSNSTAPKIIKTSLLYAGVLAVFMLIRYSVLQTVSTNYDVQLINNSIIAASDPLQRFATAVSIMGKYLVLLIIPYHLVFDYSYNTIPLVTLSNPAAFIPLLVYLGLAVYAVRNFLKKNIIVFGILFFMITMSLVSNIFFMIEATMAERFLYMPSLGFCIAIVLALQLIIKPKELKKQTSINKMLLSQPLAMVILTVCLLFSIRTFARNRDWKNNLTLLSHDVKTSPESARIRYAYGSAILIEQALKENDETIKQNLLQLSINELEKGVALIPEYADAWYHLGIAYKENKDAANAVRCFEMSRSYRPFKDADAYVASGLAYGAAGKLNEAIADLTKATEMDPQSAEAFNNLGLHLSDANKINESIAALNKAISLKPDFSKAYYNLGNTYAKSGDYNTAVSKYKTAIGLNQGYGDAYNNIGNCYAGMNMSDSARVYYQKAIEIDPTNVKAVINLGITFKILGDPDKANQYFTKAREMGAQL